jgi:hypothetical protein
MELALIMDKYRPIMKSNWGDTGSGTQADLELMQIPMLPFFAVLHRIGVLLQNIFLVDVIASDLDDMR